MVDYAIFNIPLTGRNLAASRSPRLQPSVPPEYADMLSGEVARGEWSVDPENGEPLNAKGQNLQQHLEFALSTRPHWLLPEVLADEADAVWLSETPNISARGNRFNQLKKFVGGNEKAARALFEEEALRYGITKPFSLQPGTKPGEQRKDSADQGNLTTNPWSPRFHGDEDARAAKIASIIKQGTQLANALAKAAGTVVGKPLRK